MLAYHLAMFRVALLAILLIGAAPGDAAQADDEPRRLAGRVEVVGDGFVRVSAKSLRSVGISAPGDVWVERAGKRVPTCTSRAAGDLVFLAMDTLGENTATASYELVRRTSGEPRQPTLTVAPGSVPSSESAARESSRGDARDKVFGELAGADPKVYAGPLPCWFVARLDRQRSTSHTFDPGVTCGDQRLQVRVYASYRGVVSLRATWAGNDLGVTTVEDAAGGATLAWTVAADRVPSSAAPLVLENLSPEPPPAPRNDISRDRGVVWVDAVSVTGRCIPAFHSTLRSFDVAGTTLLKLRQEGSGDGERFAVLTGPAAAAARSVDVPSTVRSAPWLDLALPQASADLQLHLGTTARAAEVVPPRGSEHPLTQAARARHVILCVPPLLVPARRLAAHRGTHGIPSRVIDVRSVYEHYGHGERTVESIRAFVRDLRERETPLDYLLLAGDALYDRTDWSKRETIPTPMARTLWNGATPSDQLYVRDTGAEERLPSVGRLPFRRPATLTGYVDRLIQHETNPPADASRRLLRFLAGESGMGVVVDRVLEIAFRRVLDEALPTPFEVEVTNVSPASPFHWPLPDLNAKIIRDINQGCLIYTFVGHGSSPRPRGVAAWDLANGVFTEREVQHVDIRGPRPLFLVLASSTATFESPKRVGIGEALLQQPGGPLAYWGSTRSVHPIYNALIARGLATAVGARGADRVGPFLDQARAEMFETSAPKWESDVFRIGNISWPGLPKQKETLKREGAAMYNLLGDPALALPLPGAELTLAVTREGGVVTARVDAALPDAVQVHLALVRARNDIRSEPPAVKTPHDEASFDALRDTFRRANDRSIARAVVSIEDGHATAQFEIPSGRIPPGLAVVAYVVSKAGVQHTATAVPAAR